MIPRVLIIISDLKLGTLVEARLEVVPYETVLVQDGEAGIAEASQRHLDLVIIDATLPGISSYQTIRKIKALAGNETVPFFVLSERAEFLDVFKDIGIQAFMIKPVIPHLLLKEVQNTFKMYPPQKKSAGLIEKTAIVAGAELLLLDQIKKNLESNSWKINLGLNKIDIFNEIQLHPPQLLIMQFWESPEVWNAKEIMTALRPELRRQKVSIVVFCIEPLKFEAKVQMRDLPLISYVKIPDLLTQLKNHLVQLSRD